MLQGAKEEMNVNFEKVKNLATKEEYLIIYNYGKFQTPFCIIYASDVERLIECWTKKEKPS